MRTGGWTYSPSFHPVVVSPSFRNKFVESSVKLLEDYGLDGLDIDYEYPQNDEQARGYTELLKELRHALDHHQRKKGIDYHFLLTVCLASLSMVGNTLAHSFICVDCCALWSAELRETACD